MTCKDCLYYEPCSTLNAEFKKHPKDFIDSDLCAKQCTTFKDRSRFVELPCKFGDTLFVPTRNLVSEYKVVSFHVCGEGIWYRTNVIKGILTRLISDNVENIGKTVFLTREEAERALKERENNG